MHQKAYVHGLKNHFNVKPENVLMLLQIWLLMNLVIIIILIVQQKQMEVVKNYKNYVNHIQLKKVVWKPLIIYYVFGIIIYVEINHV